MKISILTLGCKVNQAESFSIEKELKASGHEIVNLPDKPDVCIINTCSVTSKSDYQSRQLIRRANRAGARVFVTGCYSELNRQKVASMEGVDELIDNKSKLGIPQKMTGLSSDPQPELSGSRSRLFIKIQDGCNNCCSYCVIPKARGASRSITPDEVITQVNDAVSFGYREVVLTGIHLGTYSYDFEPKVMLYNILETILKQTKISRIRLSSLEVSEIDDRLLELVADKRVCSHLHIPLQSGDDKILRLMNRTYRAADFTSRIRAIYDKVPGIAIGTDVIVGFPGEGRKEFENTYNLLKDLPLSYMHIFPFSPRPGTPAATMTGVVTESEKKERVHELEALNARKKMDYMSMQIDRVLDVIVENSKDDSSCVGTSDNYLKVQIESSKHPCGTLIPVKIEGVRDRRLFGKPVK